MSSCARWENFSQTARQCFARWPRVGINGLVPVLLLACPLRLCLACTARDSDCIRFINRSNGSSGFADFIGVPGAVPCHLRLATDPDNRSSSLRLLRSSGSCSPLVNDPHEGQRCSPWRAGSLSSSIFRYTRHTRRTLTSDDLVLLCRNHYSIPFRSVPFLSFLRACFLQSPSLLRCPNSGQSAGTRSKGSGILKRIPFCRSARTINNLTSQEDAPSRAKRTD